MKGEQHSCNIIGRGCDDNDDENDDGDDDTKILAVLGLGGIRPMADMVSEKADGVFVDDDVGREAPNSSATET